MDHKNVVDYKIRDGTCVRIVHVNRLERRFQPNSREGSSNQEADEQWSPPLIDHSIVPAENHVDAASWHVKSKWS